MINVFVVLFVFFLIFLMVNFSNSEISNREYSHHNTSDFFPCLLDCSYCTDESWHKPELSPSEFVHFWYRRRNIRCPSIYLLDGSEYYKCFICED